MIELGEPLPFIRIEKWNTWIRTNQLEIFFKRHNAGRLDICMAKHGNLATGVQRVVFIVCLLKSKF